MAKLLHKIAPNHLQPGMFIEELDRPWLETPLKFQSFYIRSLGEVKWIKENCAYVLVDRGKSDATLVFDFHDTPDRRPNASDSELLRDCLKQMILPGPAQPAAGGPSAESPPGLSLAEPQQPPQPPHSLRERMSTWLSPRRKAREAGTLLLADRPTDQQQIQRQVARAEHTYRQAHKVMSGVLNELRAGGELDVSAVERVIYPVIDCVLQSTDAMACVLRMKETDDYLYNHALATSIWSVVFGKSLGFDKPNLEVLGMGGLLLDIGKTRVPRELLAKATPLDAAELAEVRRHVEHSIAILDETGNINPKVYQMVQTHHERHDGSGYPQKLAGNAIPVFGRIAGLVDTYDAMTSLRPYSAPLSTYSVMRTLVDAGGKLFQEELIERFIRVVGIFPTASLVELNTGEVGIVVEQNALRRLRPKVMLILDGSRQLRSEFPVVDLAEVSGQSDEAGALWIVQGLQPGAHGIDPREYYL
jgi:HD-GYP domain-containing protein (c-di-GMP phosphodiesterase class II)